MKINMNDLRIILQQAERKLRVDENFLEAELKKGKLINEDKLLKNVNKDIQRVKPVIERVNNILNINKIDIEDTESKFGIRDILRIGTIMTREDFLKKVENESWCISKYGFNDDFEHCSVKMGGNCNWCFKDAIKDIKFRGEI